MTREEAKIILECMATDMIGAMAGMRETMPMLDVLRQRVDAINIALTALDAIDNWPTLTPPNEALTLEQLREMNGEPVWFDTIKRWGIVKVCRDGVFIITKSGEFEVGRCKYYRRPPEGET